MQLTTTTLDLGKGQSGHREIPPSVNGEHAENTTWDQLRILLVEDEFLVAHDAAAILKAAGHEVVGIAVTAADAIEMAEEAEPDLVLMDIRLLGERDGIDAAVEIKRRFGIRSLFMSAFGDEKTRARAAAAEPVGFLAKPLTKESLLRGIKNAFS